MDLECFFFAPYLLQTIESKIVLLVYHCFSSTHRVLYAECSFYIFGTLFSAQVLSFDTTEMPVALNCTLRTCCILLRSLSKCKFSHSPIVYTWILHTRKVFMVRFATLQFVRILSHIYVVCMRMGTGCDDKPQHAIENAILNGG